LPGFLLHSGLVLAITDEEIFRNFQFSFVNPGARSSAMGNAFIALADDATAAEANPAGLTILVKPEVSFEYRNVTFDSNTLNSVNDVNAAQQGVRITSFNNLETFNRPSFVSFVYPYHATRFAFSRQEAVRIRGSIDETFNISLVDNSGIPIRIDAAALGLSDQQVTNYNFTVAHQWNRNLSIGGSIRYSKLSWETAVQNSLVFGDETVSTFQTQMDDTDSSFAFNIGSIYRCSPKISIGAVYKKNPKFTTTEVETGEFAKKPGPFTNTLKLPDVFGVGAAFKPNDQLTITSDVVRIEYSDLLTAFEAGYNIVTSTHENEDISYQIHNVYEFHIGGEVFILVKNLPIAIRQGYYRKPSNALLVASAHGLLPIDQLIVETIFSKPESESHITVGSGVVFDNFQVDVAFDASRSSNQLVISTVIRF